MSESNQVPIVLVFAGLDPSGGAGLQADIEALSSQGCHVLPVATAITVQDTRNVVEISPVDAGLVARQAETVLEDSRIDAIKIGLLGSVQVAIAVGEILKQHPDIPVVLDPLLAAGGGHILADDALIDLLRSTLIPGTTVLTPNSEEARRLGGSRSLDTCASALLDLGADFVLITGAHEPDDDVTNKLYSRRFACESFHWPRLPNQYHGSGCTLAAAIAGLIAQQVPTGQAVHQAQEYTWKSLESAYRSGRGQLLPNRLFWAGRQRHYPDA